MLNVAGVAGVLVGQDHIQDHIDVCCAALLNQEAFAGANSAGNRGASQS
jgi:hypothetical protein